jgi:membrane protease YdiL (CAAX protease family)
VPADPELQGPEVTPPDAPARSRVLAAVRWPFWNAGERRPRALWRIAAFVLVSGLMTYALSAVFGRRRGAFDTTSITAVLFAVRALVTTLVATIVAVRLVGRRPVRELGIVPVPGWWGDLGFGLGLGAALMSLIFAVEWVAGWVQVDGFAVVRPRPDGTPGPPFHLVMLGMVVVALCVGIYEEVVSRGFLLREFAQGLAGRWIGTTAALVAATLVSSVLFALGHANNPNASVVSTVNIVLAGVMLALPFVLTGRLAASIGLHVTWNFFQSAVYGFPTSGFAAPASLVAVKQDGPDGWTGGAFGPEAGIVGLVAMLLGCAAFYGRERMRSGRVEACAAVVWGHPPPVTAATPAAPSALPAAPAS